jgi:Skp family chaperone for outer membrane proteins
MNISKLGWVCSGALAVVMVGSGFQAKTDKIGVVDMARVFQGSEFYTKQGDALRALANSRKDILDFLRTYPVFTPEQSTRFKELSIKPNRTAPEKAELEKIKQDVMAANKKFNDLNTKASPTADEVAQIKDFVSRTQAMTNTLDRWAREFQDELDNAQEKAQKDAIDRVKAAVKEIGGKQGYTLVLNQDAAPYGANTLTDEAIKVMNAKR